MEEGTGDHGHQDSPQIHLPCTSFKLITLQTSQIFLEALFHVSNYFSLPNQSSKVGRVPFIASFDRAENLRQLRATPVTPQLPQERPSGDRNPELGLPLAALLLHYLFPWSS